MDDRDSSLRAVGERVGLAALGAIALTAERADTLADALAETGGMRREDARRLVDDLIARWRGETVRLGARAGASLEGFARDVGLVTRAEVEELELRVAQLEHRLRLLEDVQPPPRP